jgi:23S rRNA pseudouridine1911/1915/1917 synthase
VAASLPGYTRARLQRLIAAGLVTLNGAPARKSDDVVPGDRVDVMLPAAGGSRDATPVPGIELPVLFEDADVVVIDKPAGLAVHGGPGDRSPTVARWFAARHGASLAGLDAERPGVVHRLDKDTTGVLVLAKNPAAQAALGAAFEQRRAAKTYLAVCDGEPHEPRAIVDAAVGRSQADRTKMAVSRRGRPSRTEYEVLGAGGGRSFLLVRPETGRTHQIRVHLAAIGVPVTGDGSYGSEASEGRQLLHAWRLRLPHPRGGTLAVTAPLPADMASAVRSMGLPELASLYARPCPATRDLPDQETAATE